MERTAFRDATVCLHEYPDPDTAASATRYPWVADDDESITAIRRRESFVRRYDTRNQRMLSPSSEEERDTNFDVREIAQDPGVDDDPDYLSSGDAKR